VRKALIQNGGPSSGLERQRCKVCGVPDKFDFSVADEVWQIVVPIEYQDRVVCLSCFDDFAFEKRINYSTSVEQLYFAGEQAVFSFRVVSGLDAESEKTII
jgi:hypothetical protein